MNPYKILGLKGDIVNNKPYERDKVLGVKGDVNTEYEKNKNQIKRFFNLEIKVYFLIVCTFILGIGIIITFIKEDYLISSVLGFLFLLLAYLSCIFNKLYEEKWMGYNEKH